MKNLKDDIKQGEINIKEVLCVNFSKLIQN